MRRTSPVSGSITRSKYRSFSRSITRSRCIHRAEVRWKSAPDLVSWNGRPVGPWRAFIPRDSLMLTVSRISTSNALAVDPQLGQDCLCSTETFGASSRTVEHLAHFMIVEAEPMSPNAPAHAWLVHIVCSWLFASHVFYFSQDFLDEVPVLFSD